jgi:hypothetical protein
MCVMQPHLHRRLQRCDGSWVVEVLLCPCVGAEVVVPWVRHCMRLSRVLSKRLALTSGFLV